MLIQSTFSIDIACGLINTCSECADRKGCTWCLITQEKQRKCQKVATLHHQNNQCIAPKFHSKQCTDVINLDWQNVANNPRLPLALKLTSPTFGQVVRHKFIPPMIEMQLLDPNYSLETNVELCFWIYQVQSSKSLQNIDQDITTVLPPTFCNNHQEILTGVLSVLEIPTVAGSYVIAVQVRSSSTKQPRSSTAFTLIERYPIEIHEWSLFREDYLLSSTWWNNKIDASPSSNQNDRSNLGNILLFHNQASSTSRHLNTIPLFTSVSNPPVSNPHRVPKIMHQIWTGGIDELERFQKDLPLDDKRHWFLQWKQTCQDINPTSKGWQHYFWDLVTMREFVVKYFPNMLTQYDNMDLNIKRTDLFRMLVLLVFGGTYVDIDFECLQPFANIISYKNRPLNVTVQRYGRASENILSDGTITLQINADKHGPPPLLYLCEHQTNLPKDHLLKGR